MSLPDTDAIKARLRIENTVEDGDIAIMRDSALAVIESKIGRPLEAAERTFVIESPSANWDGVTPVSTFFLPLYPVKDSDADLVTITDADDNDVTGFRVNAATGKITATGSTVFANFPYTVTA